MVALVFIWRGSLHFWKRIRLFWFQWDRAEISFGCSILSYIQQIYWCIPHCCWRRVDNKQSSDWSTCGNWRTSYCQTSYFEPVIDEQRAINIERMTSATLLLPTIDWHVLTLFAVPPCQELSYDKPKLPPPMNACVRKDISMAISYLRVTMYTCLEIRILDICPLKNMNS